MTAAPDGDAASRAMIMVDADGMPVSVVDLDAAMESAVELWSRMLESPCDRASFQRLIQGVVDSEGSSAFMVITYALGLARGTLEDFTKRLGLDYPGAVTRILGFDDPNDEVKT